MDFKPSQLCRTIAAVDKYGPVGPESDSFNTNTITL
jgi:hypothetical protein